MIRPSPPENAASTADVAVVGDGLAGLTAALAFAQAGWATLLFTRDSTGEHQLGDTRTTALFEASVQLYRNLGVWSDCRARAEPLRALRMVDATGRLVRAPEVLFRAAEIGLDAFGRNIANAVLSAAMFARARRLDNLSLVETGGVQAVLPGLADVTLTTREEQRFAARLVVAADGRRSICRQAAGIGVRQWSYGQTAIACGFWHELPHEDTSTEFHRKHGPLTTVPLTDRTSSLVWSERPETAERLMALDDAAFAVELEAHTASLLGAITQVGPRAAFPVIGLEALRMACRRIALVGEAGHVLPPIGAQGLNLGLRDVAALVDAVAAGHPGGGDPGRQAALMGYEDARRADVASRTLAVDIFNRTLTSDFPPAHMVRSLGLATLGAPGPLKRALMRQGMQPADRLPRLMRNKGGCAVA